MHGSHLRGHGAREEGGGSKGDRKGLYWHTMNALSIEGSLCMVYPFLNNDRKFQNSGSEVLCWALCSAYIHYASDISSMRTSAEHKSFCQT